MAPGIRARERARAGSPDGLDQFPRYAPASGAGVRHARRSDGLRGKTRHPLSGVRAACAEAEAQGLFRQFPLRPQSPLVTLVQGYCASRAVALQILVTG